MKFNASFRSLRIRLLLPMIATAVLAAVVVALASDWLASRWANDELASRFEAIRTTLTDTSFPLTGRVLDSLAKLTQTELIGLDSGGRRRHSTRTGVPAEVDLDTRFVTIAESRYRAFSFATDRGPPRSDQVTRVVVLFDEALLDRRRQRTAMLPLLTGLSTIAGLTSITYWIASRLVTRIGRLQRRVARVAQGDFQSTVCDDISDELGTLGKGVDAMATQLDQLWRQVHRQQGEKLLHQIAGGLAHQLRNSLTGARLAVELHAAECRRGEDEGVRVAIEQMELSEDYVRRLLLVARGQQDADRPTDVRLCFKDLRRSLSPLAKHLGVTIDWSASLTTDARRVIDGPTWVAAATNLIQNAVQAGTHVCVDLTIPSDSVTRLRVLDNGRGVPDDIAGELFEPFVTSKPEGMGLGLSFVRRAAEQLRGHVRTGREDGWTVFELDVFATEESQDQRR